MGLGYVGLPLALEAARAGLQVVGVDEDEAVVSGLNQGRSHVDDITDGEISDVLVKDFVVTTDPSAVGGADVVVICVPTPLDGNLGPNLHAVEEAARTIAHHLKPGLLVVLESTTYPGTTEELLIPLLEGSGLIAGQDFMSPIARSE